MVHGEVSGTVEEEDMEDEEKNEGLLSRKVGGRKGAEKKVEMLVVIVVKAKVTQRDTTAKRRSKISGVSCFVRS